MRMPIPLTGGSESYLDIQFNPERTINMYEMPMPDTKESALVAIPGSKVRYTNGNGTHTRKLFVNLSDLFAVYEGEVVKHDTSLNAVSLGTIGSTAGHVGVAANNTKQIVFVDNVGGWVYAYSGTPSFLPITDVDFPAQPIDCTMLDNRILVAQSSSNKWFASDIDDATSYNALNFTRLTSDEELLVGIRVVNRRIFVFGNFITEVFYNSGNASQFPYVRDNNVVLQFGCASVKSIAQDKNKLAWLASQKIGSPTVQVTTGGIPKKISSPAVEYSLQSLGDLSDACGYLKFINGQDFYLLNISSKNISWLYSFATDKWVELQMIDGSAYFACTHAYFNNKHYLGHYNAPKLSEFSNDFTTNDTENIHCLRITAPIRHPTLQRLRTNRLEIQGKQGSGAVTTTRLPNGQYDDFEQDPQLYLSVSHDNGMTYSGPYEKPLGKVGQYDWETVWTQLGIAKSYVLKLETFHAARTLFLRASADMDLLGY